ncbi:MAG: hypothetical protein WAT79_12480 [Saprospiraceae bacterium]
MIRQIFGTWTIGILTILLLNSCSFWEDEGQFDIGDHTYQLAIPLVNTKATVGYLSENSKGNVTLRVDPAGKTTVYYNGEVLRRTTANFFPPYPGLAGIPIPDTSFSFPVPFKNNPEIRKAVFRNTKLYFYFEHDMVEDISVRIMFKNLYKNNKPFEEKFTLNSTENLPPKLVTEKFNVDGWEMISDNNSLDIYYEAIRSNGEKIILKRAEFYFDFIQFAYLEGYIGYHLSPVSGNLIDINLFDKWVSGSFDFENPKVSIIVDNSFGFPVRSKINRMDLTSITGKQVKLESEFIEKGIDFNYPFLNEIGQIKTTHFSFDRHNSNIRDIFNEKTKTIYYDISAEINPEKDPSINGFLDEKSFYSVNVAAEIPLNGKVNEVVVTDTTTFDPAIFKGVENAGFKLIFENTFPMDLTADVIFLNENKDQVFSLFGNESLILPSPGLDNLGKVKAGIPYKKSITLQKQDIDQIRTASFVTVIGKINTVTHPTGEPVWIFSSNGLLLQMGALVDYKR